MKAFEKRQALVLRTQGLSYREIETRVRVSKGSLSRWLKDVSLPTEFREHLDARQEAARARFRAYNQQRRIDRQRHHATLRERSAGNIATLTERELLLVGTALYWGEGTKGQPGSVVEFVNADPGMIALMMRWFRECCEVPERKFRGRIQLHNPAHVAEATTFWSRITGIPSGQFTKPLLKISPSSRYKRGNILSHGTFYIRISDVQLLTRIRGWVDGLRGAPSSSPA